MSSKEKKYKKSNDEIIKRLNFEMLEDDEKEKKTTDKNLNEEG